MRVCLCFPIQTSSLKYAQCANPWTTLNFWTVVSSSPTCSHIQSPIISSAIFPTLCPLRQKDKNAKLQAGTTFLEGAGICRDPKWKDIRLMGHLQGG